MKLEKHIEGVRVTHRNGRRGQILEIGERRLRVAWWFPSPDGSGEIKVRRVWTPFRCIDTVQFTREAIKTAHETIWKK
jgi:hypothetical protein